MSSLGMDDDIFDSALEAAAFAGFGALVGLAIYGIYRGIDWLLVFWHS
jgi:hypothetical protein